MSHSITCPLCGAPVAVLPGGSIEEHVDSTTGVRLCDASGQPAPFHAVTTSDGPLPLTWPVDANSSPVEAA